MKKQKKKIKRKGGNNHFLITIQLVLISALVYYVFDLDVFNSIASADTSVKIEVIANQNKKMLADVAEIKTEKKIVTKQEASYTLQENVGGGKKKKSKPAEMDYRDHKVQDGAFEANASWYGEPFHGRKMANGEVYNMYKEELVAHKSLPFGTKLEIINPKNNRVLYAVVTDRGPYIPGREFDLSYAGAQKLGMVESGVEKLSFRIIEQ